MVRRRIALACVLLVALGATACSSDDSGSDTTPVASTTTTSETTSTSTALTTMVPTTTGTTSTTAAPTTTVPPTTSVEDLKALIASEYLRTRQLVRDLLHHPTLDNLESRVADIAAPDSEYYVALIDHIHTLVEFGDVWKANDPEIDHAEVRAVELVGAAPYTQAVVTICDVSNDVRVNLAENSPSGTESRVGETGELVAALSNTPMVRSDRGWVQTAARVDAEVFMGVETCGE